MEIRRYWRVADREHTDSFEDTVAKVRELICDSIRRQLVSDVPLGSFLSGGLDSSIIAAVAAERAAASGDRLKTFSVFYKDNEKYFKKSKFQPNSDSDYIDIVCAHLGCENVRVVIDTQELVSALFDAVDARDLPGMADADSALLLACREVKSTAPSCSPANALTRFSAGTRGTGTKHQGIRGLPVGAVDNVEIPLHQKRPARENQPAGVLI